MRDAVAGALLLGFAVFMYLQSFSIRTSRWDAFGAARFPQLLLIVLGCLACLLMLSGLAQVWRQRTAGSSGGGEQRGKGRSDRRHLWWVVAILALFAAYLVALDWIGFTLATFLYLTAFQLVLHTERRGAALWKAALLSGAVSLVLFFALTRFLYISLPGGRVWGG